jgi:hypothetical protein
MIAHLVLLQPRESLGLEGRQAALNALLQSARTIPGIARFRIGRRVRHGLPGYEQEMTQDYEFALVLEFESLETLKGYLSAPAHGALGDLFTSATSAALSYDYDLREAADLGEAAAEWVAGHP